jgi:hypothetical protein
MKKILLVLVIPLLMGAGCTNQDKYDECIDACEYAIRGTNENGPLGECKITCVEKYK